MSLNNHDDYIKKVNDLLSCFDEKMTQRVVCQYIKGCDVYQNKNNGQINNALFDVVMQLKLITHQYTNNKEQGVKGQEEQGVKGQEEQGVKGQEEQGVKKQEEQEEKKQESKEEQKIKSKEEQRVKSQEEQGVKSQEEQGVKGQEEQGVKGQEEQGVKGQEEQGVPNNEIHKQIILTAEQKIHLDKLL